VAGTYVLERINTEPLPAVYSDTDQAVVSILADTMRLGADKHGTETRRQRVQIKGSTATPGEMTLLLGLGYETDGDRLRMGYLCSPDPGTLCLSTVPVSITAELTPTGLRMHVEGNELDFRRID
jgi:hypothetical protein